MAPAAAVWLDAARADLLIERSVTRAARQWDDGGRHDHDLYREGRLQITQEWSARSTQDRDPLSAGLPRREPGAGPTGAGREVRDQLYRETAREATAATPARRRGGPAGRDRARRGDRGEQPPDGRRPAGPGPDGLGGRRRPAGPGPGGPPRRRVGGRARCAPRCVAAPRSRGLAPRPRSGVAWGPVVGAHAQRDRRARSGGSGTGRSAAPSSARPPRSAASSPDRSASSAPSMSATTAASWPAG